MKKLLILVPLLILISCGVQKRKYQKGYYVNWTKPKMQPKEVVATEKETSVKKQSPASATPPVISSENQETNELEASVTENMAKIKAKPKKTLIQNDEPCDELIFKDGTELKGKVVEITPTEIKYKKCSMLDGPVFVTKKSDIFMVKYANGTKEVFKSEAPTNNRPGEKYTGPVKTHSLAIVSIVLGILGLYPGFFYLAIIAVLFANIARKDIIAKPEKYEGMGLANTGRILGIIGICIAIVVIMLALLILLSL